MSEKKQQLNRELHLFVWHRKKGDVGQKKLCVLVISVLLRMNLSRVPHSSHPTFAAQSWSWDGAFQLLPHCSPCPCPTLTCLCCLCGFVYQEVGFLGVLTAGSTWAMQAALLPLGDFPETPLLPPALFFVWARPSYLSIIQSGLIFIFKTRLKLTFIFLI